MRLPVQSRRARHGLVLTFGFLLSGALLTAPSAFSQDARISSRAALRKDPQYARLYHDEKEFLALPPEKQESIRKLHEDLDKLAPAEREWLKDVLRRYADWLDRLPETDRRKVLDAPNKEARLKAIKELRDVEWLAKQPKAQLKYLAGLPKSRSLTKALAAASIVGLSIGTPRNVRPLTVLSAALAEPFETREAAVKRLKKEESRKARDWLIASRHWNDLTDPKRPPLPAYAADFGKDVETYIKEYLLPVLTPAEKDRLERAEGHWPHYPMTLVELADKHPLALPQRDGPTTQAQLPAQVQKSMPKAFGKGEKAKKFKSLDEYAHSKGTLTQVEKRLAMAGVRNPTEAIKFACSVADLAHTSAKGVKVKLPNELWAAKPEDMGAPMQLFLSEQSPFMKQLEEKEKLQLAGLKGRWPEYPLKIQEFARRNGFFPPWQTLPEGGNKGEVWNNYRLKPQNQAEAPLPAQQQGAAVAGD